MNAFNLFSEPFTNALGWALVHTIWQGTVFGAAAALAFRLTQNRSSAVRYGIGIGTLALQLLTFLATMWLCYEPVRTVMQITGEDQTTLTQTATVLNFAATSSLTGEVMFWLNQHISLLVTFWGCGAALLLVRLFGGWLFVQRLTRRNINPAPEAWQTYLYELSDQLGITKAVRLVESAEISVPMTIGWIKPIVLLPIGLLAGLSPRQVEAILAHELAHIQRNDYLVNLILSAVEIVLFFHPAIWWLSARVREEREHCCDDVAIDLCGERASLAQALVRIEERRQAMVATPALAMAFGARKQSFLQRVKRVIGVNEQQSSSKPNGLLVAGCLMLLAGLVTGQHVYHPANISRKNGDSVMINTWKSDTTIQQSISEDVHIEVVEKPEPIELVERLEPVMHTFVNDTIDPVNRVRLKKELEHHMLEIERLEKEIGSKNLPMGKFETDFHEQIQHLTDSEINRVNLQMKNMEKELHQNIQKSVDLEYKKAQLNGKLSQLDTQKFKQAQVELARVEQRMNQLNESVSANIQEKLQKLNEGQLRFLNDSMRVISAKTAALAQKASIHAVEILKLHQKLYGLDSLPNIAPTPFPEPVPAIAPVPNVNVNVNSVPRPAKMPKPATAKGQYWYNGKRYNSPSEMPAAAVPPAPPLSTPAPASFPAPTPVPPVPAIAPVVDVPPVPAEATENVRIKHWKSKDSKKSKTPRPAKAKTAPKAKVD
jgi:beta-lactamase regulating signal transducer with metallopeptidase domain